MKTYPILRITKKAKIVLEIMLRKIKSKIKKLSHFYQWSLMIGFNQGTNEFHQFKKIIPPKDRLWADPFVYHKNEKYFVFFEELIYSKKIGHISVFEVDKTGNFSSPKKIIEKDYHLSYPYLFDFENELYLIHGSTKGLNSFVELFKCEEFPYKWKFFKKILENIPLVDTTIFYYDKKWWLFGCKAEIDGSSQSNELLLFFSENPINSKWISHPLNPIITDIKKARPAGKIFRKNGNLIRPAQNCDGLYGRGFSFNKIIKINENEYEEEQVEYFEPEWDSNIIGIHTFNSEGSCVVIDGRIKRSSFG